MMNYQDKTKEELIIELQKLRNEYNSLKASCKNDINEQQAKEKLEESEAKYRKMIQNMNSGVAIYQPINNGEDFRFIDFNKAAERITNSSAKYAIGKTLLSNFPNMGKSPLFKALQCVNKTGEDLYLPPFHYKDNVREGWRENYIYKLPTGEIVAIFDDITKRKKAEIDLQNQNQELIIAKEKAEESETKFSRLFDKITDPIFAYNPDNYEILEANNATAKLYGYEKPELIGMSCLKFSSEIEKSKSLAQKMIQKGSATVKLRHHKKKDGTDVFVELTGYKITVKEKNLMFAVCKDITEKLKAEQALRRSESKFRALFEQSGGYCMILDPNTHDGIPIIHDANEAAYKKHGYTREEFIGQPINLIDDAEGKKLVKERTALIMTGKPFYVENVHVRKDGSLFTTAVNAQRIDIEGEAPLIFTTEYDISEKKEAEEALITAKEQAQESDRLKSAFLANMSHEIRTPMNGILGFAELLKEPNLSGEEQQRYIGIIEKSGIRMLNIINDIIDISKIESGLIKIQIRESNVNEQIEYVSTFFKPEAEAKGLTLLFKNTLPSKQAIILTDREKVFAILTNLVKNAIKYTNSGSIEFGYDLVAMEHAPMLQFYVKDTGIGIPLDRQEAIFERFMQADIEDKMARQGAGLGLTISKAYIGMLGGKIWVESTEGQGSAFYFTLPYTTKPEKKIDSSIVILQPKASNSIDADALELKVLIAEDDETSGSLISIIIKGHCKEIITVASGIEAVESCRNNPDIDLILMDIQMPKMDGYEATKKIRGFNKNVIIIAQTAYALKGDKEKALKVGCNDYITKPINKKALEALIRKYFKPMV
jgi:PAS domain S-box-containing protein